MIELAAYEVAEARRKFPKGIVKLSAAGRAVAGSRRGDRQRGRVVGVSYDATVRVLWDGQKTEQRWAPNFLTRARA